MLLYPTWGVPVQTLEAIAYHHSPGKCTATSFNPGTAVHVANVLDHEQHSRQHVGALPTLHLDYLDRVQCREHLDDWRKLCQVEK